MLCEFDGVVLMLGVIGFWVLSFGFLWVEDDFVVVVIIVVIYYIWVEFCVVFVI